MPHDDQASSTIYLRLLRAEGSLLGYPHSFSTRGGTTW
jgi:hypothetical protein